MKHIITTTAFVLLTMLGQSMGPAPGPNGIIADRMAQPVGNADIVPLPATPTALLETAPIPRQPVIRTDDPDLAALARWGIDRYTSSGLDLPAVEIRFHDSSDPCLGNQGTFDAERLRVDMCVAAPGVLLHELGHAWAHAHLTSHVRDRYVEVHGLGSWNDPATQWSQRGFEHAAETLAWGLAERPIRIPTPDGPIAKVNAAFRLLTGSDAPRVEHNGSGGGTQAAEEPAPEQHHDRETEDEPAGVGFPGDIRSAEAELQHEPHAEEDPRRDRHDEPAHE